MKKLKKVSLFNPEGSDNSALTREEMSAIMWMVTVSFIVLNI